MITFTEKLENPVSYDISVLGKPEEILFFDIETTGLSADYCTIYLIGCVYYSDGCWYLKQFFADSVNAEGEILLHFFTTLSGYPVLIHFNGDTFDIPFVYKRADKLHIPHKIYNIISIDLYKKIKPFKNILGLPNCKQKSIETFLGINRTDKYNGGQLIEIYKDYLLTHSRKELDLLILHNADDLKGLPKLLPILYYTAFLSGNVTVRDISFSYNNSEEPSVTITAVFSDVCLPSILNINKEIFCITAKGNTANISVRFFNGELKHFYSDYKNYYYLPDEDAAIHKSVAEYVDYGHKIKATAKNCYSKKKGSFMPVFSDMQLPLFYKEYPRKQPYILIDEALLKDKDFLSSYCISILKKLKQPS